MTASEFPPFSRMFGVPSEVVVLNQAHPNRSQVNSGLSGNLEWSLTADSTTGSSMMTRLGTYKNLNANSGFVAPLTTGDPGEFFLATNTIVGPGGWLANYRWMPGDAISLTGGTVDVGYYTIISADTGTDTLTLAADLPAGAGDTADVEGQVVRPDNCCDVVIPAGVIHEGSQIVIETTGTMGGMEAGTNTAEVGTDFALNPVTLGQAGTLTKAGAFTNYTLTPGDLITVAGADASILPGSYYITARSSANAVTITGDSIFATSGGVLSGSVSKIDPLEVYLWASRPDGLTSIENLLRGDAVPNTTTSWRPRAYAPIGTTNFRLRYTITPIHQKGSATSACMTQVELWQGLAALSETLINANTPSLYQSVTFQSTFDLRLGVRLMPMLRHHGAVTAHFGSWNVRNLTAYLIGPKQGLS